MAEQYQMVKRKAQAKQSASDEPKITAGETIIDAELERQNLVSALAVQR